MTTDEEGLTKIAIVGAGAMGSVYAALLADAGNDVWAIDPWTDHVEAIATRGLRIDGPSGTRVVHLNATTDPSEVGACDLVVIATKARDVEGACEATRLLLGPATVVLPIQNGIGSADRAAEILGPDGIVVGVVGGFGASMVGPGHVHHHALELVRLGEYVSQPVTSRLQAIAGSWRRAGFKVEVYDDVNALIWAKLLCNVAFSGPCAVLGCTIGEIVADPHGWELVQLCVHEAWKVREALGVDIGVTDPVAYIADFASKMSGAAPSMVRDLAAGRPTEIDIINGAIPPLAAKHGLSAPFNEAVTLVVHAREQIGAAPVATPA